MLPRTTAGDLRSHFCLTFSGKKEKKMRIESHVKAVMYYSYAPLQSIAIQKFQSIA
jgi:hypothetical protein